MTVGTEWIAWFERLREAQTLPRVRALHLPPAELAGTKQGEFCALELEDGALGLSYVLLDDTLARLAAERERFALEGADALLVARRYVEGRGVERTLGFAAINALTRSLFDRAGYEPPVSMDSIGQIDPQPQDHVGMIGLFTPLLDRVVRAGAHLTVVELKPELAGERDGYRVTLDAAELAGCEKILTTSTILLNDTLDRMLASCGQARIFAMIGPGAGCLPDPLFARGVTRMGGSWITDTRGFLETLASGGKWSAHARKCAIDRADYPGTATLLARAKGR
jgi:uncharacterized protein (DUF4213/DUF364 family)